MFVKVDGMSCVECVNRVTQALLEVENIVDVKVSLEKGMAVFDTMSTVEDKDGRAAIEKVGYDVVFPEQVAEGIESV